MRVRVQFSVFHGRACAVTQKKGCTHTLTQTAQVSHVTALQGQTYHDKPARVFQPGNNNRRRPERQRLNIVMTTQTAHVNQDVPPKSIQLSPQLLMLAFKPAKVKKLLTGICNVGPQVIGPNIRSQTHTLDPKARAVMKLKNAARGGCARRFLEAGAADIPNNETRVATRKGLRIVNKSRDLKATDALERPAHE